MSAIHPHRMRLPGLPAANLQPSHLQPSTNWELILIVFFRGTIQNRPYGHGGKIGKTNTHS
jgi:hypothetical protein